MVHASLYQYHCITERDLSTTAVRKKLLGAWNEGLSLLLSNESYKEVRFEFFPDDQLWRGSQSAAFWLWVKKKKPKMGCPGKRKKTWTNTCGPFLGGVFLTHRLFRMATFRVFRTSRPGPPVVRLPGLPELASASRLEAGGLKMGGAIQWHLLGGSVF